MQSNINEAALLPIDSFIEKDFPFTDITLRLSAEAIKFLMGTTKDRPNLMYYLYILHAMTIGNKSQTVRGIRVDTDTCQCSLSVSSLEELWGIKRKQGRNLLDKMEQLNLIRRSSDFVTSIVDVVSVLGGHAGGKAYTNPCLHSSSGEQPSVHASQTDATVAATSDQGADKAGSPCEASKTPQEAQKTASVPSMPSKTVKTQQSLFDFKDDSAAVVP